MRTSLPCVTLIGHSGCGKDEVGKFFNAATPLPFRHSSSWYLAEIVAHETAIPLAELRGPERRKHKEEMFRIGNEARAENPGVLVEAMMADGNRVLAGLRTPLEVSYARHHHGAFTIWIDRDVPWDETMREFGVRPWKHADIRIDNTGDFDDLWMTLSNLTRVLDFSRS